MSGDQRQCPSIHKWSGQQCIREAGHDGYCWGKGQRGYKNFTRAEWSSKNGLFASHHQYDTKYPANAAHHEPKDKKEKPDGD